MIKNKVLATHSFLKEMDNDNYYPTHLVKKGQDLLKALCVKIEATSPKNLSELYILTQETTDQFNELAEEFYEEESEIETVARECIAEDFGFIADEYGFENADIEELIATRDW
ncbi:DUF5713 family protein [Proteus faecis]|uniref:DUF5713 family protein n=1 Tax=Proteus faecis TaxID=2050967 RepID=A0AAW7CKZ6_9GAMM|nr:DUF5713 family protein [Proteus faecis]MBG3012598.1 hypothetical protein [Proteus mirabilis]MDL5166773.1 DUF5713 family protein [Proteus faecis]MDL5274592.1 DUF5713 family protein [Proteus faecis]MDL5278326.1 DUF5713 family protein [Proteus faecis]MDL5307328.1 DUF5713 family protein [Proteus faecis]